MLLLLSLVVVLSEKSAMDYFEATVELQNLQTLALFEAILPQCFNRPCNFARFIFCILS